VLLVDEELDAALADEAAVVPLDVDAPIELVALEALVPDELGPEVLPVDALLPDVAAEAVADADDELAVFSEPLDVAPELVEVEIAVPLLLVAVALDDDECEEPLAPEALDATAVTWLLVAPDPDELLEDAFGPPHATRQRSTTPPLRFMDPVPRIRRLYCVGTKVDSPAPTMVRGRGRKLVSSATVAAPDLPSTCHTTVLPPLIARNTQK
jgi:hypothetical protein